MYNNNSKLIHPPQWQSNCPGGRETQNFKLTTILFASIGIHL